MKQQDPSAFAGVIIQRGVQTGKLSLASFEKSLFFCEGISHQPH